MKKLNKILGSIICITITSSMLCACGESETGMPYGVYTSDVGKIRYEDDSITFEDMDEDFLNEMNASQKSLNEYFEKMDEGVILSSEEMKSLKEQYLKSEDLSEYANKEFSFEYKKYDEEYFVHFMLYDDEYLAFGINYYMEDQYISFGDKEFRIEE